MKTLYPDQLVIKKEIYHNWNNGIQRQILGAGCGAGKTVIATNIVQDAISRNLTPMFVVNQIELVNQAALHLYDEGLEVSIYQGENTHRSPYQQVIVASIQTLQSRQIPLADFLIFDEVHVFHQAHEDLLNMYNALKTLGLSATPMRKGLGKYFQALVRSKTMKELIAEGRLTPYKYYGAPSPDLSKVKMVADDYNQKDLSKTMNKASLNGDIVDNWLRLGEGAKTICFPVDVAHSKAIVEEFNSKGIWFEHVDAYTNDKDRRRIFHDFNKGSLVGLSSVGVLTTGFDAPIARCLINAGPTKSLTKFIQKSGRVARKYEGKEYSIFIDHTGDISDRHGFPHDFVIPDLDDGNINRAEALPPLEKLPKPCPKCQTLLESNIFKCPNCGHEREKIRKVATTTEDLKELTDSKYTRQFKLSFARQLLDYSSNKGFKDGWAYHAYKQKFKEEPETPLFRLRKTETPTVEVLNYIRYLNIRYAKSKGS